jgi:hypothetical protein
MRVLHRKMELTAGMTGGKIDRSADALRVRHRPFLFPSSRFSTTRLAGNGAGKTVEHGRQRAEQREQIMENRLRPGL